MTYHHSFLLLLTRATFRDTLFVGFLVGQAWWDNDHCAMRLAAAIL